MTWGDFSPPCPHRVPERGVRPVVAEPRSDMGRTATVRWEMERIHSLPTHPDAKNAHSEPVSVPPALACPTSSRTPSGRVAINPGQAGAGGLRAGGSGSTMIRVAVATAILLSLALTGCVGNSGSSEPEAWAVSDMEEKEWWWTFHAASGEPVELELGELLGGLSVEVYVSEFVGGITVRLPHPCTDYRDERVYYAATGVVQPAYDESCSTSPGPHTITVHSNGTAKGTIHARGWVHAPA